ncbi:rCG27096 [Rattus norvegicus]|uniref:RCG27096 n=1 Tax=Rattus norvegicus TaxID=10116 RepID=A6HQK7_RAT|nr:rCG27096 [Rattus norvegicus]
MKLIQVITQYRSLSIYIISLVIPGYN